MRASPGAIEVRQWLAARRPAPPRELANRLARIVGSRTCEDFARLSASLVEDAEQILANLEDDRGSAADLLAADALITYAIEAAAEDCSQLEASAREALLRISRTASA